MFLIYMIINRNKNKISKNLKDNTKLYKMYLIYIICKTNKTKQPYKTTMLDFKIRLNFNLIINIKLNHKRHFKLLTKILNFT